MDDSLPQDDGLKWFGEGFDGFPKRLPDDCVEYVIYVIDEKLRNIAATRTRLNQILKTATAICKEHTKDCIWQRETFELKLRPTLLEPESKKASLPEAQPPHLRGRTSFGDAVADEWLIVYLLLELSKQCPDAWIRVYDTDGEFLLIEAANALPKWLNPDIAEHRVWINNGHLRIVPLGKEATVRNLSLQAALSFIQSSPDKLIISPFIEDEAFYRLRDYPKAIGESLHHALVTVPRRLAYLLHQQPAYVSPAVEAFYLRDPIALKPLATKDLNTLRLPPEDFVTVSVKFTKVGYAQLRSQVFDPPPAWTGILPRMDDEKVAMGMKLTCGFEMLLADPKEQDTRVVREIKVLLEDVESGDEPLPNDRTILSWSQRQDDEKWLDIDYNDFDQELAGKKGKGAGGKGFGDQGAQENLRKMVSRFEDFLKDDEAGVDGIDDEEDSSGASDNDADETDDGGEDKEGSFSEAEFERAMKEMMGMPADEIEKTGLLAEARKLALEDEEMGNASKEEESDEDQEMKKIMEMYKKELKGHGALRLDGDRIVKSGGTGKRKTKPEAHVDRQSNKVMFGPERPPGMQVTKLPEVGEADEEVGPGEEELSSDDEEFNDVDLNLAKNMLESFKGQAGMAGPAGAMLKRFGINMPRDEGSDGE